MLRKGKRILREGICVKCIKGIHYQAFIWNHWDDKILKNISFEEKKWTWCLDSKIVKPVWLTRFQTFIIIDIFALSGKSNKPMLEKSKKNISKQGEKKTTRDLFKMGRRDG